MALGSIYNLLGRYAKSKTFFELTLAGRLRGTSRPHRSFAALGLARALKRLGTTEEAVVAYRVSLKLFFNTGPTNRGGCFLM